MSDQSDLFSLQAREDLFEIWTYIAARDVDIADKVFDRIMDTAGLVVRLPNLGRGRDEFGRNMRSIPIGPYVMFYAKHPRGVVIIRVLHGSRDIPPFLS